MYLQELPGFRTNYEFAPWLARLHRGALDGHADDFEAGYRKFFPLRMQLRLRRARVGHAFTSDCDPFNLYCPVATRRVAALGVDARFVITLRDPVRRAYSDFNMHRTNGGEQRSFRECIEDELAGREIRFRKRFVNQSRYAPHVRRWVDAFGRDRILVVRAEDYFEQPARISRAIDGFLGLPTVARHHAPHNVGAYAEALLDDDAAWLRELLRESTLELSDYLGRNFDWS